MFITALLTFAQVSASDVPVSKSAIISPQQATTSSFSFFRGHRQGKNISLTWGMTSNSDIIQFIIQCTYDDPTDQYSVWATKGVVSNNNSHSFKFKDTDVLPGTMHYRIIALSNSAPPVISGIETIRIVSH